LRLHSHTGPGETMHLVMPMRMAAVFLFQRPAATAVKVPG
jgi:hypothetical protein